METCMARRRPDRITQPMVRSLNSTGPATSPYSMRFAHRPTAPMAQLRWQGSWKEPMATYMGLHSSAGPMDGGRFLKITPPGKLTTLYSFCPVKPSHGACSDGAEPTTNLMLARNGSFFGATLHGGLHNAGTIFEITPTGKF